MGKIRKVVYNMKRIAKSMLALVLVAILLCAPALAASATYTNARDFVRVLDANGLTDYTLMGIDSDGDDGVMLDYSGDYWDYTIRYYFNAENDMVLIRIWNLMEFDDSEMSAAKNAANDANYDYKIARFYVDDTDNTLTCSYDLITREGASVGECLLDATGYLVNIIDAAHTHFAAFE